MKGGYEFKGVRAQCLGRNYVPPNPYVEVPVSNVIAFGDRAFMEETRVWHPNFIELVSLEEKEGTVESSLSLAPPFPCSPFPSPSSPLLSSLPPLSNLCLLA